MSHKTSGGAIGAAGLAALVAVAALGCDRTAESGEVTGRAASPTVEIEQAPWRIKMVAAGHKGRRPGKKVRRLVKRHRPQVRAAVIDVYDALFLAPERRGDVLSRLFTSSAARALRRSQAGVPAEAEQVKIVARRATIGVESVGARRAAAGTAVKVRGRIDGRRFRLRHRATMWLERSNRRWRIIAFDVRQGPIR